MKNNSIKKYLVLGGLVISISHLSTAQKNYGFYGKTNFVEFTSVSYLPLLRNTTTPYGTGYEKLGNSLTPAFDDWFDTGFRVSIGRAFKRNFGLSFEYGRDFWSTPMTIQASMENINSPAYFNIEKHERIKMHTTHFMPKMHFATKSALLPLGVNHEFGIGLTSSKVVKEEYAYVLADGSLDPGTSTKYLDFERAYYGLQFLYCLRMRKPLNKHLLLNYGLRYTGDVQLQSSSPHAEYAELYSYSNYIVRERVRFNLSMNVLSFDFGLTYAF